MRMDRSITIGLENILNYWNKRSTCYVPILMYHSVSSAVEQDVHPYFQVTTTPEVFEQHIVWLKENGFRGVALRTLLDAEMKNDARSVVLTFDDGFADFYSLAWPVLQRYGFSATVFLPTGFIDTQSKTLITGKTHLTWEQVRELDDAGVEFGSHTVTHPILYLCDQDRIRSELLQSKYDIETRLGKSAISFSYPFALPTEDCNHVEFVRRVAIEIGYRLMVSTHVGLTKLPLPADRFLKRIPINNADDAAFFAAKLHGAYDWMGPTQAAAKKIRSFFGIKRTQKRFQ